MLVSLRVLGSDKAKLFCTREEIKQWRRERGSCADYLDYCTQVLASRRTNAGRDAGDDAEGDGGVEAMPGWDSTPSPLLLSQRRLWTARYRGARTGASPLREETRQRPWRELPSRQDYGGG